MVGRVLKKPLASRKEQTPNRIRGVILIFEMEAAPAIIHSLPSAVGHLDEDLSKSFNNPGGGGEVETIWLFKLITCMVGKQFGIEVDTLQVSSRMLHTQVSSVK